MDKLIVSGKYKIIKVLTADDSYEASLCINVMVKNDYAMNVINTYKGKQAIKEYLPMYYSMENGSCKEFIELMTSDGSISAVFMYQSGTEFFTFFEKHSHDMYEEKLEYAQKLLKAALELDLVDDRIAACVLDSNVVVDSTTRRICFNYIIHPTKNPPKGFRCKRLGEMLQAIFTPDRYLPEEIEVFAQELADGKYRSCVEAYSTWRSVKEAAEKTRRLYEKESLIQYLIRRAKRRNERLKQKRAEDRD